MRGDGADVPCSIEPHANGCRRHRLHRGRGAEGATTRKNAELGQGIDNATNPYLDAIRHGDYEQAINRYAGQRYTQHSTPVKDGKAGFIEFFADFVERNPIRDIEILRGFEDGPYVFLHVLQTLNDGEFRYVTADIFDTDDDGKLIDASA